MTADVVKLPFRFDNTQQPWTVIDGRDVLDELASLVAVRDSRCILVTSATLARETALVHRASRVLGPSLARTVTGVQPHVPRESALELAQTVRAVGADVVVSLGGGTVTDTVKAARMAISFGCSHPDDFDALVRPPSLGPSPVGQQGYRSRPSRSRRRCRARSSPTRWESSTRPVDARISSAMPG